MKLDASTDIQTLFIYRYLLDKPDPIVDLKQDIEDLTYFPERVEGSYRAEWLTYVKKQLHQLKQQDQETQTAFWQALTFKMEQPEEDEQLSQALSKIEQSLKIASDSKVSVIKIPVKTYIEQLLSL
jgi:hypothetical protein